MAQLSAVDAPRMNDFRDDLIILAAKRLGKVQKEKPEPEKKKEAPPPAIKEEDDAGSWATDDEARIEEERKRIDTLKRAAYRLRVDQKAAAAQEWAKKRTDESKVQKRREEEALVFAELVQAGLTADEQARNEQQAKNLAELEEQRRLEKKKADAIRARQIKKAQDQAVADYLEHAIEEPLEAGRVKRLQEEANSEYLEREKTLTEAADEAENEVELRIEDLKNKVRDMHLDVSRLGPGPHYRIAQNNLRESMKELDRAKAELVSLKDRHREEAEARVPTEPVCPAAHHKALYNTGKGIGGKEGYPMMEYNPETNLFEYTVLCEPDEVTQFIRVAEEESSKRQVLKALTDRMDRNRQRTKELQESKIETAEAAVAAEAAFQSAREVKHQYLNKFSQVMKEINDAVHAIKVELQEAEWELEKLVKDRVKKREEEVVASAEVLRLAREVEAPLNEEEQAASDRFKRKLVQKERLWIGKQTMLAEKTQRYSRVKTANLKQPGSPAVRGALLDMQDAEKAMQDAKVEHDAVIVEQQAWDDARLASKRKIKQDAIDNEVKLRSEGSDLDARIRKHEELLAAGQARLEQASNKERADEAEKLRLSTGQAAAEAATEDDLVSLKNEWDSFFENEYLKLMQARQVYEARLPEHLHKKYLPKPEVVKEKVVEEVVELPKPKIPWFKTLVRDAQDAAIEQAENTEAEMGLAAYNRPVSFDEMGKLKAERANKIRKGWVPKSEKEKKEEAEEARRKEKADKLAVRRAEIAEEKKKRDARRTEMVKQNWAAMRTKNKAIRAAAAAKRQEIFDEHERQKAYEAERAEIERVNAMDWSMSDYEGSGFGHRNRQDPFDGPIRVWNRARRVPRPGSTLLYVNRLSRPSSRAEIRSGSRPNSRGGRPESRERGSRPSSREQHHRVSTPPRTGTPSRMDRVSTPPRTGTPPRMDRGITPPRTGTPARGLPAVYEDGLGEILPIGEEGEGDSLGDKEEGVVHPVQEAYPPGVMGTPLNPWGGGFGLGQTVPLSRGGVGPSQGTDNGIATPFAGQQRGKQPSRTHLGTAMSSPTVIGVQEDIRSQLTVLPTLGFSADVRSATVPRGSRGPSRQSRLSSSSMGCRGVNASFRQRQHVHETYNQLQFHKNVRKQASVARAYSSMTVKSGYETTRMPFSQMYGGMPGTGHLDYSLPPATRHSSVRLDRLQSRGVSP